MLRAFLIKKKIDYMNSKIEYIRVLKGTNFNYFSDEAIRVFFGNKFVVSNFWIGWV